MKKTFSIALLLSFLVCYLEWGNHKMFMAQMEYEFLFRSASAGSFSHPLVLMPFAGQLLLIFTLFQKDPNRKFILAGLILLGLLVSVIFLVGILGSLKILLSTLPYLITSVLFLRKYKSMKPFANSDF